MRYIKKFAPQITTVLLITILVTVGVIRDVVINTRAASEHRPVVIIDAGHGGFDGGAVAQDGTIEKDINLNISLRLCKILEFNGYNVVMTRTTDTGTEDDSTEKISLRKKNDMYNRLKLMDKYPNSIYVSIHLNKFTTSSANGAQVFYSQNFNGSKNLGEIIQKSLIEILQPNNQRVAKPGNSSTFILKKATVPTVIVECGFLSNKNELEKLKKDEYQSQLAFAIFAGINEYYLTSGE